MHMLSAHRTSHRFLIVFGAMKCKYSRPGPGSLVFLAVCVVRWVARPAPSRCFRHTPTHSRLPVLLVLQVLLGRSQVRAHCSLLMLTAHCPRQARCPRLGWLSAQRPRDNSSIYLLSCQGAARALPGRCQGGARALPGRCQGSELPPPRGAE